MKHPLLATRLYNTPLMIEPNKASVIESVFRQHQVAEHQQLAMIEGARPAAMDQQQENEQRGPQRIQSASLAKLVRRPEKQYDMTASGIAVIPVVGTLVQRTGSMQPFSGMVPYAFIGKKLEAATEDPEVKGVLLEFDTYGGEVSGCFELAEQIIKARSIKPVWAHANEVAYSAGYALACSASRFLVANTGGTCNIGTLALHVDESKYDARMGFAYTYIYFGARKKDGNPHEPLSEPALNSLQGELDRLGMIFAEHVAAARGIDVKSVLATEAAGLNPEQALAGKFCDGICTFAEAIEAIEAAAGVKAFSSQRLAAGLSHAAPTTKESTMEPKDKPAASAPAADADQPKHTDTQLEAARTTAHAAGVTAGTTAERTRITGILGHAEAKERGALALSIATETEMSVEQAGKVLAAAPKHAAGNALAAVMSDIKNPDLGAGGGEGGDSAEAEVGKILAVCRQNGVAVAKAA